jgi:hypothetical protein
MDQQIVEHQLRQAQDVLQRRQDQIDKTAGLTNTSEMTNRLVCMLRTQLADMRQSRDTWREKAETAQRLLAKERADETVEPKATNGAAT